MRLCERASERAGWDGSLRSAAYIHLLILRGRALFICSLYGSNQINDFETVGAAHLECTPDSAEH